MAYSNNLLPCGKKQKGFTLVELLIALFIFSLLALFAYRALNTLMQSENLLAQDNQALNALQKAFLILEKDFQQQINLPVFTTENDAEATAVTTASASDPLRPDAEQNLLAVTTLSGRQAPQIIRYSTRDNTLYRSQSPRAQADTDNTGNSEDKLRLIAGISAASADIITTSTGSQSGVQLSLQHEQLGTVSRIFALPSRPARNTSADAELSQESEGSASSTTNGTQTQFGNSGSGGTISDEDRALMNDN